MKKLSHSLSLDQLSLLADFLENGYSLKDCLQLLESFNNQSIFCYVTQKMEEGITFEDAISHFQIDKDWLEYFLFAKRFSTLQEAIRSALTMVQTKKRFQDIIVKQLRYPCLLIFTMIGFTIFFGRMIIPQMQQLLTSFSIENNQSLFLKCMLFLPFIILGVLLIILCIFLKVLVEIKRRNYISLFLLLKIPFLSTYIQYYYSLKFAGYYRALSSYVPGIQDSIYLMYELMYDSDLMVVIDLMKRELENGVNLEKCIESNPFFHDSLINHWQIALKLGNVQKGLEDYFDKTVQYLEKKIKKSSQLIIFLVYIITAIFIISLYLSMMMPMMKIANEI